MPPEARDESLGSVLAALAANSAIAVAKGTAAALTGSPALSAETLHTSLTLTESIHRSTTGAGAMRPQPRCFTP